MHVELLREFADHGVWANKRLLEVSQRLAPALLDRQLPGSFPSLRTTWMHIRNAECMWHLRLSAVGEPRWPAEESQELATVLPYTEILQRYVSTLTAEALEGMVSYTNLRGEPCTQVRWRPLLHCLNHSTYHRGQVVQLLRSLGVTEIPNTDLVNYQRSQAAH